MDPIPPTAAGFTPDTTPPPPKTSGWAIGSLVTGIMGVACLPPFLPTALSIIFGILGLNSIRGSSGRVAGSGMCIAGIVLGVVALFTNLIGIGVFYFGKIGYDVAKSMQTLAPAVQQQDWDKIADELGGPGGLTKEEIKAKLDGGFAEHGKPSNAVVVSFDADQGEAREFKDISKMPFILGVNLTTESGPAHLEIRMKRVDGKMRATGVRFGKGHLAIRIHGSDFK